MNGYQETMVNIGLAEIAYHQEMRLLNNKKAEFDAQVAELTESIARRKAIIDDLVEAAKKEYPDG